jgi:Dolichyl-phosphate-mannose-protein mannosyltransferase
MFTATSVKQDLYILPNKTKTIFFILFCLAIIARVTNFFHLGFYYDLIETQYDWAKHSVDQGFFEFWRTYRQNGIDYLPGAMYVITPIQAINKLLFGGGEYGFGVLLKLFNTINDIIFAGIIYYFARIKGKTGSLAAFGLAITSLLLPSLWFISAVWGQFDTFPINISLIMCLLLHKALTEENLKLGMWSGVIYGATIWFKLQAILLLPALIVLFISAKKPQIRAKFINGFIYSTIAILIIPIISNAYRVGFAIAQVVVRSNNVTNGASTFWPLVDMVKYGNDDWFSIGSFTITASKFAYLVYIFAMGYFGLKLLNIVPKNLLKPLQTINKLKMISLESFILITAISSSIYFMFFTKMMSRYLHWGYLFSMVFLALIWNTKYRIQLLIALALVEIGYFLNQIGVYGWWNSNPYWPDWIIHQTPIDKWHLSSWLNLIGLVGVYVIVITYLKDDSKSKNFDSK